MLTKVFTTLGGNCPFGKGIERDSAKCRQCEFFYKAGTGTFFWCSNPGNSGRVRIPTEQKQKTDKNKAKKGRKAVKGKIKAVQGNRIKNG